MSEDSQILFTTEQDIERLDGLIVGNSVRSMRIVFNRVKRRMIIYEARLVELYRNESIIKARIYNNSDAIKIATEYTAGKNKKNVAIQSFAQITVADDPHQNIMYNKFNTMTLEDGVRKLDAELNRINTEIKELEATLNLYKQKYDEIKKRFDDAEKKKDDSNKIGKFLAPTREELVADQIAQAKTTNILLLQGISKQFRDLSTVYRHTSSETGKTVKEWLEILEAGKVVGYPDGDRRTANQLRVYQQLFYAHGHAKGLNARVIETSEEGITVTEEVVPLSTLLNFDNPGDTKNLKVLEGYSETARGAARSTKKMSLKVTRYLNDVKSVVADPIISKGVEIRPDISISVSESMRVDTLSYPVSAIRIGDFYLGSFEMPTLFDTIRKNWKKKQSRMYFGLPVCPDAKPTGDEVTSTDAKEEEAQEVFEAETLAAQDLYEEKLKEAERLVEIEVQIQYGDLPITGDDAAPEWVKIYVQRFGKAGRGLIVYLGNQVTVLRGTSDESVILAKQRANDMIVFTSDQKMEEKSWYSYESVVGYTVKIGNTDIFVSVEEMIVIDAGQIPARIKEKNSKIIRASTTRTEIKEFVAYVMWGLQSAG